MTNWTNMRRATAEARHGCAARGDPNGTAWPRDRLRNVLRRWRTSPTPLHANTRNAGAVKTTPATMDHERPGVDHARARLLEPLPSSQDRTEFEKKEVANGPFVDPLRSRGRPLVKKHRPRLAAGPRYNVSEAHVDGSTAPWPPFGGGLIFPF